MVKHKASTLLLILAVCALVLAGCGSGSDTPKTGDRPATLSGEDFVLTALEGGQLSFADLKGKVVVIDFWATWCKPCITEIPEYNALYQKYKDKPFAFVAIALDSGTPEQVRAFVSAHNITYPVYLGNQQLASHFAVQGLPTTLVLNAEGKVQKKYVGAGPGKIAEIEAIIAQVLPKS